MKKILCACIPLLLLSCKSKIQQMQIESGIYTYHYKEGDNKEELILKKDSSFIFNSYKSSCTGRWKYIDTKTLLIRCDNVDITEMLGSNYMSVREKKVRIVNYNKLELPIENNIKMKSVILKRE